MRLLIRTLDHINQDYATYGKLDTNLGREPEIIIYNQPIFLNVYKYVYKYVYFRDYKNQSSLGGFS